MLERFSENRKTFFVVNSEGVKASYIGYEKWKVKQVKSHSINQINAETVFVGNNNKQVLPAEKTDNFSFLADLSTIIASLFGLIRDFV